jgi:hypothetical protein
MLTDSGGWKIFSGHNEKLAKIIDRCFHSTHVVSNILIGSLFSTYQLLADLFFVFNFLYNFLFSY